MKRSYRRADRACCAHHLLGKASAPGIAEVKHRNIVPLGEEIAPGEQRGQDGCTGRIGGKRASECRVLPGVGERRARGPVGEDGGCLPRETRGGDNTVLRWSSEHANLYKARRAHTRDSWQTWTPPTIATGVDEADLAGPRTAWAPFALASSPLARSPVRARRSRRVAARDERRAEQHSQHPPTPREHPN
eukprot:4603250-Prymnesium_polylepis.1